MTETTCQLQKRQFLAIACGTDPYLVPIDSVTEVVRTPSVTRGSPRHDASEGEIRLRGAMLPVIDLRRRLGYQVAETVDEVVVMVLSDSWLLVGFQVDSVDRVLAIGEEHITAPPEAIALHNGPSLTGLVPFGDDLFPIIDPLRTLSPLEKISALQTARH